MRISINTNNHIHETAQASKNTRSSDIGQLKMKFFGSNISMGNRLLKSCLTSNVTLMNNQNLKLEK